MSQSKWTDGQRVVSEECGVLPEQGDRFLLTRHPRQYGQVRLGWSACAVAEEVQDRHQDQVGEQGSADARQVVQAKQTAQDAGRVPLDGHDEVEKVGSHVEL